jgi:hypothetical protein
MKSNNNNNDDDDDDDNNNNTAMGSVHPRGDTFLTFGLKALTETNTSRLATGTVYISETLVSTCTSTRRYNPEDQYRHIHRCQNIKPHESLGSL